MRAFNMLMSYNLFDPRNLTKLYIGKQQGLQCIKYYSILLSIISCSYNHYVWGKGCYNLPRLLDEATKGQLV